ncbi:hypothetical protein PAXRUDRAFT_129025 [Paxillus rubicundulus Ve08.2h10]|uniref:Uncharacterized protein n=1 Tax=Paxillus rubicundulus Ve08.2h10 TaxID=930991 RepID=A0A0D0E6Q7_9AGAM|nr:hypothetical protein PAXRUDRAFT_129025 [Paxillus rubicundulus Ve08.2h10]
MSSNTASADSPTCLTLVGPSNFQIWKLHITVKLQREKVLGTDTCLIIPVTSLISPTSSRTLMMSSIATLEEVQKWMEWNEKAHGIIWDNNISDALLLKMEAHTTA